MILLASNLHIGIKPAAYDEACLHRTIPGLRIVGGAALRVELPLLFTLLAEPLLGSKDRLADSETGTTIGLGFNTAFSSSVPRRGIGIACQHDGKNLSRYTSSRLMITYVDIDALVEDVFELTSLTEEVASANVDLRWKSRRRHCRSIIDQQLHSRIKVLF